MLAPSPSMHGSLLPDHRGRRLGQGLPQLGPRFHCQGDALFGGCRLPASPWEYLHVAISRRPLKSRKVTRLFFAAFCWNLAMMVCMP
jgi:hypothetical protein